MTPFRIAVVGGGPSGFYAAEALLRSGRPVLVDMFERLPAPFGLVRYGVAPDHPKLKQVTAVFHRIAAMPGFRFVGGAKIGTDVPLERLLGAYHAVALATGAAEGRTVGVPGESLAGAHQAGDLVGWYNGHPDFRDRRFDFDAERAVVIGHGNVALDVARILMKTPDELSGTDIAAHALEQLALSRIREIVVVGRRGPAETRFSLKELEEFDQLADCDPHVEPDDLDRSALPPLEGASPEAAETLALLARFAGRARGKPRRCVFRFGLEPVALHGRERVAQAAFRGARGLVTIDCGLVVFSVGRRTPAIAGVPHDATRGVHANVGGRVVSGGAPVPGLYVCGWSKRGPSGVIGTNRACAIETVEAILADLDGLAGKALGDVEPILADVSRRAGVRLDFAAWRTIDAAEIARGRAVGKPREKFVSVEAMIAAAQADALAP